LRTAQGQISFSQPPTYAGTGQLFVADFSGGGKPGILAADGTLNLGNGDGTFKTVSAVMGTPLAVTDFNGDGKPDVGAGNRHSAGAAWKWRWHVSSTTHQHE
jgi:hypothetical protein